jgi:hypothetical protein
MNKEFIMLLAILILSCLFWFFSNKVYEGLTQNNNNINQNNEQILNDIQSLQKLEQEVFNNLETNTTLTAVEKQKLISKINELSNMRINLYKTLSGVNEFYNNALKNSVGTLQEQTVAIGIVETELNRAKKRLEILEEERNNKIRLVEINEYYGDKYEEHSQLMKIIIFMLIPIILFTVLKNKGLLPQGIYTFLVIVVSWIGAVYLWRRFGSIITRDNMNYQEYNWSFDPSLAPNGGASSSSNDPWASKTSGFGTCVGQACCSQGQVYDTTSNQCVIPVNQKESFENINNVLTKQQQGKFKTDYDLNNDYIAPLSSSIINETLINK